MNHCSVLGPAMAAAAVLLFTRYPQPGKAKTRLIGWLGTQGAAALHARMTEEQIRRLEPLLRTCLVRLEIHHAGGTKEEMASWLGIDHSLVPQQGKDLGDRMRHAFVRAWQQGTAWTILIGSDCPGLDAAIVRSGFEALHDHDLVLGPAVDGGCYLVGLRAFACGHEQLFGNIAWGTDQVLRQMEVQAKQAGLSCLLLPALHDVDRPEDLVHLNFNCHPDSE